MPATFEQDPRAAGAGFAHEFAALSPSTAIGLLESEFGWRPARIERLDTERDDTFRVDSPIGRVIAKFAHPLDVGAVISDQVTVLSRLAAKHPELPVPRVVPGVDGVALRTVVDDSGNPRLLRVLTYLPGEHLGAAPRDGDALRTLGRLHGVLAAAIASLGIEDPLLHGASTPWNLLDVERYAPHTAAIEDAALRTAAENVIRTARDRALPALAEMPALLAHNDLHGDNILVATAPFAIVGVVDFGDMTLTPRVADLAIAASYARGYGGRIGAEPWSAARAYVAGFEQLQRLSAPERALLPDLILLRLAQRAALNSLIAAANPRARGYATRNVATIARDLVDLSAQRPNFQEPLE